MVVSDICILFGIRFRDRWEVAFPSHTMVEILVFPSVMGYIPGISFGCVRERERGSLDVKPNEQRDWVYILSEV